MKLSVKGLALALGIIGGAGFLFVGLVELAVPGYGHVLLKLADSIYPWFDNGHSLLSVLNGTAHAAVDGAIGGALLAWLYNWFS